MSNDAEHVLENSHDLRNKFDVLKQAANKMENTVYEERKICLKHLLKEIKKRAEVLSNAVNKDFGHRPVVETKILELIPTVHAIKFILKHLKQWMQPQTKRVSMWFKFGGAQIIPQPLGVVGIIVPWNYPIQLALIPLVSAVAAGNRVMLKLSELTPNTNHEIRQLLEKVFSKKEVVIVEGDLHVAKSFSALPFDYLMFTGSTETGRKVMAAASQNLTPVTLELGGKSPVIIGPDYPMQVAVERLLTGKLFNAGQTCIAPDYVFISEGSESLFVECAHQFIQKHYPNFLNNADVTTIINQEHYVRLLQLCKDAVSKGAQLISLVSEYKTSAEYMSCLEKNLAHHDFKFLPCLFVNVPNDAAILNEEIFGPILPMLTYKNIAQIIRYINERPRPLALYLFEENAKRIDEVLSKTISGGVTLNDTLLHAAQEDLPFGGVGESGMGCYHGKAGFDAFTHYRSVFLQTRINGFGLLRPPFKKIANVLIKLMMR